ncbi:MAG TPA: ABC transporter permease [Gemmatimonadaceae bacterium]|jgi:putative ABC transport system permease protein
MNPFRWFGPSRRDDLSEEIQSHIDEKTDELIARGMSRVDAVREARRAFGNVTRVKEAAGDVWHLESVLESIMTDVRYALRGLIQKPGFTVGVVLTLALGIGANAVVFALVNAVVLRPLPYPHSERLISLSQLNEEGRDGRTLHDVPYDDWARVTKTVESSAAYEAAQAVLVTADGPRRIDGLRATHAYFAIFGVRPLMGRTFDESETQLGAAPVVVLSEQLWRDRFKADSMVIGNHALFDGVQRQIIGVLPASFAYGRSERFWIPLHATPKPLPPGDGGEIFAYSVVARLRDGVPIDAVRAELAAVLARQESVHRGSPVVMTLHERRHGETRRPLLLLFGAVGVLLLTACANIANLALARAARREREFALRLALGASRPRIVRFVLIESLTLSVGGAAFGLLLAHTSLGWFVRISPGSIGSAAQVQSIAVNGALVAYASAVAILTAVLFGLVPALTASRAPLNHTLANGAAQSAGSTRQSFARRALVVAELAVALVFLTGAGLVAKTFWRVASKDPGFRPEKLLVANIDLGDKRYTDATAAVFYDALMARVRNTPGVLSAAYSQGAPLTGHGGVEVVSVGRKAGAAPGRTSRYSVVRVDTAYFRTLGARLVAGRLIGPEDRVGAPHVVVVSEEYVRLNLEGGPALGRTIGRDQMIVGVVKDIAQRPTDGEKYPPIFVPLAQAREKTFLDMTVRTTGDPDQLLATIRQTMQSLDPAQPPATFTTMERALAEVVAPRRFTLVLLGAFAALALGLAVIGLFSVLSYLVTERTREIGVRLALGADTGRVMRMVVGQGLRLTLVGTLLGAVSSIVAVRVLRAWMYEMSVYDAPTFAAVAALLGIVALLASWLPAHRASRVDPVRALRAD